MALRWRLNLLFTEEELLLQGLFLLSSFAKINSSIIGTILYEREAFIMYIEKLKERIPYGYVMTSFDELLKDTKIGNDRGVYRIIVFKKAQVKGSFYTTSYEIDYFNNSTVLSILLNEPCILVKLG